MTQEQAALIPIEEREIDFYGDAISAAQFSAVCKMGRRERSSNVIQHLRLTPASDLDTALFAGIVFVSTHPS